MGIDGLHEHYDVRLNRLARFKVRTVAPNRRVTFAGDPFFFGPKTMYHVYVLISEKTGRNYVGSTEDIERRISEHNAWHS